LGVPRKAVGAFITGRKAVGSKRIGVVSRGEKEVALSVKFDRSRVVAALEALFLKAQHDFLGGHVERVPLEREAAEALPGKIRGRVEAVDPLVFGELRIECEAEEAVFLLVEHREGSTKHRRLEFGLPDFEGP
jgi:hypothetical protein